MALTIEQEEKLYGGGYNGGRFNEQVRRLVSNHGMSIEQAHEKAHELGEGAPLQ